MSPRWHLAVNGTVIVTVVLNIVMMAFFYGRLTQAVIDLSGRVTRLEQTIDNWRRGGAPVPVPENYTRPQEGAS